MGFGVEHVHERLRFSSVPSKTSKETKALAQHISAALYVDTDGVPGQWRMLSSFQGASVGAAMHAVKSGWIKLEGNHSISLTDEGRRLIVKHAH